MNLLAGLTGAALISMVACSSLSAPRGNGERIYLIGRGEGGQPIAYQGGPASGMMMSGGLACSSCHGADGRGGTRRVHMSLVTAPDIRWSVLAANERADRDHGDGHAGYTLEAFRDAVVRGKHPDGADLDVNMPRWSLSDRELLEVADFLRTLPANRGLESSSPARRERRWRGGVTG